MHRWQEWRRWRIDESDEMVMVMGYRHLMRGFAQLIFRSIPCPFHPPSVKPNTDVYATTTAATAYRELDENDWMRFLGRGSISCVWSHIG